MPGRKKLMTFIAIILILLLLVGGALGWYFYNLIYGPSVAIKAEKRYLYLPTGVEMKGVLDSLVSGGYIQDTGEFAWVARQMNYPSHIHPGRYPIRDGMSNHDLVSMLRSGSDEPVNLTLNRFRNKEELAGYVGERLEADSISIMELLNNDERITGEWGFTQKNLLTLFIPDTYQFHWSTGANQFLERMHQEYRKYWNESRLEKASQRSLNPREVGVLASIVEKESARVAEWDTIAGVYLNRLERGWPLESDPTVIYALKKEKGMDSVRRVYRRYTKVESPYNTYQNRGLPPGPLTLPDKRAIEAVLNAPDHEYMFFVAKSDLSGYHQFSRTLREHNNKARKYHQALNERNIH